MLQQARLQWCTSQIQCHALTYDPSQLNCRQYIPTGYADNVLETQAGFARKNNITAGKILKFR
jgi:hypothetical protein